MLMRALDQYGRGLTPGQTLWRPQHSEEHSTGAAADDGDDDGRGECSDTERTPAPVTARERR